MVDFSFLMAFLIIAAVGLILGFGKILKLFTSHVFGLIIAILATAMIGGSLQSLPVFAELISSINQKAIEIVSFMRYIKPGIVVYYVVLFLLVIILKTILVKLVKTILESQLILVKILNRIFGLIMAVVFCGALVLLYFAALEVLRDTAFGANGIEKLGDGVVRAIFDNNPISFIILKK